jgi:hypothetical protein
MDLVGQVTACGFCGSPLALRQLRVTRPGRRRLATLSWLRHDRHQKSSVEAIFLIERQVQRALREGKEAGVASPPGIELRGSDLDEFPCDRACLAVGTNRNWSEEPDVSPACREIAANQFTVEFGTEAVDVLGSEMRPTSNPCGLAMDDILTLKDVEQDGALQQLMPNATSLTGGLSNFSFFGLAFSRPSSINMTTSVGSALHCKYRQRCLNL